jgi:lipopolysaccharide transport system ATP-binding protein
VSAPIITVENLSKRYWIGHQAVLGEDHVHSEGLRHVLERALRSPARWFSGGKNRKPSGVEEFWALKDVGFEINQGDVVGIIGRNGAGKSTLLKILSRITEPTAGRIEIEGRIASLLEVGTGFHQELTGRENIFLNGAILGMSRVEIRRKFDEIVAFSEVEKFLDTPVKRYSSGMYVRLAFAVAAHLEPEILIVDEVLAVGDMAFQKKCLGKMQSVASSGRTIIFVSHNMGAVMGLCNRVVWLAGGRCHMVGPTREVADAYLATTSLQVERRTDLDKLLRIERNIRAKLISLEWLDGVPLKHGAPTRIRVEVKFAGDVPDFQLSLGFSTMEGVRIATFDTDSDRSFACAAAGDGVQAFELVVDSLTLNPGLYLVDISTRSGNDHGLDSLRGAASMEVISGENTPAHFFGKEASVRLVGHWSRV